MRIGELAARLEVVPRSATATIDALEAAALVARQGDADDRRSVRVSPTARGTALLARLGDLRRASAEAMFGRLTTRQRRQLLELLLVLNEGDAPPARLEAAP